MADHETSRVYNSGMTELLVAPEDHSELLKTLALQSKDPSLYYPQAFRWWRKVI
jgi:hypothetical protein